MATKMDLEIAPPTCVGRDEKRLSLHKLMLAQHEDAIDSNEHEDDEDYDSENDEGGIPAWIAMRRAMDANRMNPPRGQAGPSSACVTADPSRPNSASDRENGGRQGATVNVENGSESSRGKGESSRGKGELTPAETELQQRSYHKNASPSPPYSSSVVNDSTWAIVRPEEDSASDDYVEYYSGSCKVMRGGFVNTKENTRPKVLSEPFRTFPPLSNRGYMLTSTGHDPKFVHRAEPANPTFLPRSCIKDILLNDKNHPKREPKAMPEPSVVPLPGSNLDAEDHWVDLESAVSEANSTGGNGQSHSPDTVFMLCRKCGKHHIAPGSILSLGQRDTCGSYLPDWFPAEDFEYPWQSYTDLNNEIHRLENLERGFTTLPKFWDKVFHDEHPVWSALGHRGGGWWRCRSGPDVPRAEQKCYQCHVKFPPTQLPNSETMDSAMKLLWQLQHLVRGHMDRIGQKDKAIAMEMIRSTMPEHNPYLPPPHDHRTGLGWAGTDKKGEEEKKEEQPPMTEERMVLEAMWNHKGPISTLELPFHLRSTFSFPDHDVDEKEEDDEEEENGLEMKTIIPQRPSPPSSHRPASSLGSNFLSSLVSPESPGLPEEAKEVSHSQE